MSEENCNHECEACEAENCASRGKIEKLKTHDLTSFRKTIAIIVDETQPGRHSFDNKSAARPAVGMDKTDPAGVGRVAKMNGRRAGKSGGR